MGAAGTWDIVTKTPMGDQKGRLTIVPGADGTFSGHVDGSMMGSIDIAKGSLDGDRLSWKMDMKAPMPMTLDCSATVSGDAISGEVKAGVFGSFVLNGTRAG